MAMIVIGPPVVVSTDLELLGLTLKESFESCRCSPCQSLDRQYDIDCLAVDKSGLPEFVSYRAQPDYDYRTITVRMVSDRGNGDVQAAKLADGRSRADRYVQGYPSGVAWARPVDIRLTMFKQRNGYVCPKHKKIDEGSSGQRFLVFCSWCTAMHYVPRVAVPDGIYGAA